MNFNNVGELYYIEKYSQLNNFNKNRKISDNFYNF